MYTDTADWTGMFGTKSSFVPIAGAELREDHVHTPATKDHVKEAPGAENDGALTEAEEAALIEHYGMNESAATRHGRRPEPRHAQA
jgi:hypothetical protein